jgi:parallel beta-helix repeat protein
MTKYPLPRKYLTVGIILFFVTTSIIPSVLANLSKDAGTMSSVQLIINDDGSGDPTDKKVNIPAYIPDSGITPILTINFTIVGSNSSEDTAYYGDDPWEDWKNITVYGDILYPIDHTTLHHVGTTGDWNCCVTPTKPYGVIALRIDWPGEENGSAIDYIQIVNGTYVMPQVASFPWGLDFKLIVTITDLDGIPVKNAKVYLLWEEDDYEFNETEGNNMLGNGFNGEYWFIIQREDQGELPPKNITIAAQWYVGFWGYTKVMMERPNNPPLVFVDDDYNSSTPGWEYNHFNKIQDGINAVAENGTALVYSGIYNENIIMNKSLNLLGEYKGTTIINGNTSTYGVNITANDVMIRGFTIQNSSEGYGILISSNNNRITDNIVSNNRVGIGTYYGDPFETAAFQSSGYNTITNNLIVQNAGCGISLNGKNNTVNGNIISQTEYGVMLVVTIHNTLSNNSISENDVGVFIVSSYTTNLYRNNISYNEKLGVSCFATSSDSIIQNNFIGNGQNAYFNQPILTRIRILKNILQIPIRQSVWDQNYWERPRILPSMIPGLISCIRGPIIEAPFIFNYFQIDWHPAKEPYTIS